MKDKILSFAKKIESIDSVIVDEVELHPVLKDTHYNHDLVYSKALSYYFSDEYDNHYEKLSNSFKKMIERIVINSGDIKNIATASAIGNAANPMNIHIFATTIQHPRIM
jgi:hypothetical protein